MTINHIFLLISASKFSTTRAFYRTAVKPLGYTELLAPNDSLIGLGSDYPYLFLKAIPDEEKAMGTHLAIQAESNTAVNAFYKAALEAGGKDNGKPRLHPEMSRQPYYSGFVIDPDGNNLEAVCVPTH